MVKKILRMTGVWLLIILAETLHGTFRTLLIEPLIGGKTARQAAVFTGAVIFFAIAYFLVGRTGVQSSPGLLASGAYWVVLTVGFEFALGFWLLGLPAERLFSDYDLASGGLMPVGLLLLLFTPLAADRLRRKSQRRA